MEAVQNIAIFAMNTTDHPPMANGGVSADDANAHSAHAARSAQGKPMARARSPTREQDARGPVLYSGGSDPPRRSISIP